MTALYKLCQGGKLDEVRSVLAGGGDVNNKSNGGSTGLMLAVMTGHNSIVKLLLEQPAVKVNEKNSGGCTPLHYAASGNNPEGARMLLLHPGFNSPNTTTNCGKTNCGCTIGKTALMMAVSDRNKEVLVELVKHQSVSLDLSEGAFGR